MNDYTGDPTPGDWDHRSGDCALHGVNIPHFRAKGATGRYFCVKCSLNALKSLHRERDGFNLDGGVEVRILREHELPETGPGSCAHYGCQVSCREFDKWLKAQGA